MGDFGSLEAVIWDMDGVIVDSELSHFISWREVFRKENIQISEDKLRETFGMTSPQVVREILGQDVSQEHAQEISREKEKIFRSLIKEEAEFLPSVEEWLQKFKESGILQALASSGSQKNIDSVLNALDARRFFEKVVSGMGMPSKPAPDVFLLAAEKLGVVPGNCLVIEDSIAGVSAAKSAGMKCLAVTTTNTAGKLGKADLILDSLEMLTQEKLKGLFSK